MSDPFSLNLSIVPKSSPVPLEGHNTSSTSLKVSWGEVPFADRLGIIRGYGVILARTGETLHNKSFSNSVHEFAFTGLDKFTEYTIRVVGATAKGNGYGIPIFVRTDEDGKCAMTEVIFS